MVNDVKNTQIEPVPFPPIYKMPLIGERAAPFKAQTTKGPINFPFDYAGKWVVFFSHPGDFEPVCTTEFMYFQTMQQMFKDMNTELLGLSVDSIPSHLAWIQSIYQIEWNGMQDISINFPVVADADMQISNRYGMVHRGETESETVRALFIIDPDSRIRNIMYYSARTGRNMEEIKRIVQALQVIDKEDVATPANWQVGDPVVIPSPKTTAQLLERQRVSVEDPNVNCVAWYLCFREYNIATLRRLGIYDKKPIIPPPVIKKP